MSPRPPGGPSPIRTTAAPVQVMTRDDLHRAGVRYLAEAFRLADGALRRPLRRAHLDRQRARSDHQRRQQDAGDDRRPDDLLAAVLRHLLGRAGLLIDDIDRIEIIRGPGASLWGANAVHGIINVIRRRAADTQGTFAPVGTGNEERAIADVRYGAPHQRRLRAIAYMRSTATAMRSRWTTAGVGARSDPARTGRRPRADWTPSESADATHPGRRLCRAGSDC